MIILEEAAYCDPGLVAEVVVPLLSMQQSVLLCISTILDSGNHYSKMMEMQDDYGHPIFESIKITLVRSTRAHPNPNRSYTHVRHTGVRRLPQDRSSRKM